MKKVILLFAAMVLFVSTANAQGNQKIGYVNFQLIMEQYPPAIKAQSDLEALIAKWSATLDSMRTSIQTRARTAEQQRATMTEQQLKQIENELILDQQKMVQFEQQKFGQQNGELYIKESEIMGPIRSQVLDAIDLVRKEQGMNFVFNKRKEAAFLLSADPQFDLTFKVLDMLNRGN